MHSVSEQLLGESASGKGGHEQRQRETKRRKHSRTATNHEQGKQITVKASKSEVWLITAPTPPVHTRGSEE